MQEQDRARILIFVVDDEQLLLELAAAVLEPSGYEVKTFHDPITALRAYTAGPAPALLITDFAMQPMNGMDLLRECKRINPKQKSLLISGTVDEAIYNSGLVRPDRFLAKPYQSKQLLDLVAEVLAN
jgi:CheY-like chemotaxis protein